MPWLIASFPWLVYLLAAWLVAGLFVARVLLRLRDGLEVACLALPLGLVSHLLVANALGHVMYLPFALWWTALLALVGGGAWLARHASAAPLTWDLSRRARLGLLAGLLVLAAGLLALNLREDFSDDGGHATMAHLLAAGQFPLRFQCNPGLRAAYAYGGNLLAAQAMVVAGLKPLDAVDLLKSLVAACGAALAFATGWRPERRWRAGLLAVLLLFTAGPMLWIYLPFSRGGLAYWLGQGSSLRLLPVDMANLVSDPWRYTVHTPGFVTPQFAHAQRALAWSFAPFQAFLLLALLEAPLERRRRTVALGITLASTALLQPGALLLLLPGLVGYAAWRLLRRRGPATAVDANLPAALALAAALMVVQGGPVTDSLRDRLEGVVNPTTRFSLAPPILPSCRAREADLRCLLLSFANLGLVPLLLPWLALGLWRRGPRQRLVLALGALVGYAFPFFFRYGYIDWNVQRSITYATWTVAVLLAPALCEMLARGGGRRLLASTLLLVAGWGGLTQLGVIVDGRFTRDRTSRQAWQVGPLDEQMERLGPRLPLEALIFDPSGCLGGTACRPGLLFGRYSLASRDRLAFVEPAQGFSQVLAEPRPERLRAAGFTHVYLDAAWLASLSPEALAAFRGGAFETLGQAGDRQDFRALLRVCRPEETCRLRLPGILD